MEIFNSDGMLDTLNEIGVFNVSDKDRMTVTMSMSESAGNIGISMTALMKAAKEGHTDVIETLIAHGADVNGYVFHKVRGIN